jgi:hypothetical protein
MADEPAVVGDGQAFTPDLLCDDEDEDLPETFTVEAFTLSDGSEDTGIKATAYQQALAEFSEEERKPKRAKR